jgi:predicted  nucleic acid-binding Zn-ribbon protein
MSQGNPFAQPDSPRSDELRRPNYTTAVSAVAVLESDLARIHKQIEWLEHEIDLAQADLVRAKSDLVVLRENRADFERALEVLSNVGATAPIGRLLAAG